MRIDRRLTLVVPVQTDDGEAIVRSAPISAAFFKAHYMAIAKTFGRMHDEGMGATTAPRVAALVLADIERELAGVAKDAPAPPSRIMAEIGRMTMVELPGGKGTIPWGQIAEAGVLTEDDISEVENAVVFFTVASSMYHRQIAEQMIGSAVSLWSARLESSDGPAATASAPSSQTSSAPASSGARATASSIPR